jgi:glucokinase
MLLAGDIGGTKTLLGLFDRAFPRPHSIASRAFSTLEYGDLATMISVFATENAVSHADIEAAAFGVAGPVLGATAQLTNVPWRVDARRLAETLDIGRVSLLNDLQAMAYAVPALRDDELHVLQEGVAPAGGSGNRALIAAGTGLGEAFLHFVDGRFISSPSEGGHADFAARTERDITVLRALVQRYKRVSIEHVVSGPGLVNLYRALHAGPCRAGIDATSRGAPAAITSAALERRCPGCVDTLATFIDAYGAEAGNLALRTVSTAGLFVGGGIAPRILPALAGGAFMHAFRDKAPLDDLMARIPVKVILHAEPGLLGAAMYAQGF